MNMLHIYILFYLLLLFILFYMKIYIFRRFDIKCIQLKTLHFVFSWFFCSIPLETDAFDWQILRNKQTKMLNSHIFHPDFSPVVQHTQ